MVTERALMSGLPDAALRRGRDDGARRPSGDRADGEVSENPIGLSISVR